MTSVLLQFQFYFVADPSYHYKNLSDATRKLSYVTPFYALCDNNLAEGWYRFVGDAGTKMPTTRVSAYRCGTDWSGWLNGAHSTLEDGEVLRTVCFSDRSAGCKHSANILVKTVDPSSSTNFTTHLVVVHATVVQTECEANIHGAVRGLINRSVTTCV